MNKWHEMLLEKIEEQKEFIEWIKEELKRRPSDTATVPEPWASMTAKEIKESMGVYK